MSGFRPRFFIAQTAATSGAPVGRSLGPGAMAESGLEGVELLLSPEDSYHARRVLRLGEGDACEVVVGAAVYAATVLRAAEQVKVRLLARLQGEEAGAQYRSQVGLVQALVRPAVMDHVFEKGTEVGASFFLLVRTAGSPKGLGPPGEERMARWRRIAQEAAKQSKQVAVPPVGFAGSLEDALGSLEGKGVLSLVLEPSSPLSLKEVLEERTGVEQLALWVGPEGGWTAAEWKSLSSAGLEPVRLGRSVLRAETAGPVAIAVARFALGDW